MSYRLGSFFRDLVSQGEELVDVPLFFSVSYCEQHAHITGHSKWKSRWNHRPALRWLPKRFRY